VTIVGADVLRITLGPMSEECRYRAVDDKLTLACAQAAPAHIEAGPRTLVFRRAGRRG
jgi:hypothetical protein